jgi:hypothetical protein
MRLALALCLCASACRSGLGYPSEAELRRDAKSVVHDPDFTLYSPYDAAASADFANSVRAELGLVRALIPDADATPVRIYLAPIEGGEGLHPWESPSKQSLKGAATEGEFAFVYVPARIAASSALERATHLRGGTLRHELAHLAAHRAGLAGAPWFNEGLALEVESMRKEEGALHAHPFPPHLLLARQSAQAGALGELLRWDYGDEMSDSERSRRYVWAEALFRFLLERQAPGDFLEQARGIRGLGEPALRELEAAWLQWIAKLDALERIERSGCIDVMPMLAEARVPELFTRAADELALSKLGDPACVDPAATFLLFFRAGELRAEDIQALEQSQEPMRELTAQALHARRKEPVDLERARLAWQRVPEAERGRLIVQLALLPGWERLSVPAFTAYRHADLRWFGRLATTGELGLALEFAGKTPPLAAVRLTVSSQADASVVGTVELPAGKGGRVAIAEPGYYRFALEDPPPGLSALVLSGPAAAGAHFSTVERRNAASVHLGYPVPEEARDEIEWFYIELEPRTEPLYTYYEATGFDRGYFGMQVNSPTERRIIFSVWDSGNEAVDRSKVAPEDRVQLLAKGEGVVASDFGNEGTGGHSHLVHPWKLGQRFRFLLHAEPGEGALASTTTYTAWFWFAEREQWGLVASFRAPRAGRFLHGLYSFNENFVGSNGDERRVCGFGNGWVRTHAGRWIPLNEARFTHDGHGAEQRLDRSAGLQDGRFYLANGGFVDDATPGAVTRSGDVLRLEKPAGEHPLDAELERLVESRRR